MNISDNFDRLFGNHTPVREEMEVEEGGPGTPEGVGRLEGSHPSADSEEQTAL